jgi:hypothetical protein
MKLGKLIAVARARTGKVREVTVRNLTKWSRQGMRKVFGQSHMLRKFSLGGAFLGMGVVLVLAFLYDKLRARSQRHYRFVAGNFDTAARSWKRQPLRQEAVLRRYFWPVYELALRARDIAPPYRDEASFLELAQAAIEADVPLLEGRNAAGEASRIPFRQAQKLFASPPFSAHKNSVNDLRFSWYREVRDRHLGWERYLLDLTQSAPFENFLLLGFRRDLATMFSRGLRQARSGVRLEDLVATSDEALMAAEVQAERDGIRAYAARKVIPAKLGQHDAVWRVLEDGLGHVIREVVRADPDCLTGESFARNGKGAWEARRSGDGLLEDLAELEDRYGGSRRKAAWDMEKLVAKREEGRQLTQLLLVFCRRHDGEQKHIRDVGDLRAVRMALQMDGRLRKALIRGGEAAALLREFGEISRRQEDYDRALIELRGVYAACLADFEFYNDFVAETLTAFREQCLEIDYDPWFAKIFPVVADKVRQAWRSVRQKLQSG